MSAPGGRCYCLFSKVKQQKMFHLTRHGMNVIKDCKQSGFHQHSNTISPLYEQCSHVEFGDIDFDF